MKKILAILLVLVMSVSMAGCGGVDEHAEDEVDIQEMIAIFGDNGDGTIEEEEGSFPYFIANKENYQLLTGPEIEEKIIGRWDVVDKFGDEFNHTFETDGTAATTYTGDVTLCNWLVQSDYFYWGFSARPIDTSKNTRMEVREIEEGILIIYENDTNSYNGVEYKMEYPYAILVAAEQ